MYRLTFIELTSQSGSRSPPIFLNYWIPAIFSPKKCFQSLIIFTFFVHSILVWATKSRGRLILLEVIDVVPEPGKPLTRYKYKTVYDKPQRGPITMVDAIDGCLICAIGQKIFIHAFTENDLRATGFVDTQAKFKKINQSKTYSLN